MLSFLNKYASNQYSSQNGEEGCLLQIVKRLGIVNGVSCEVGGSDGLFCSNTALFLKGHGWSGLFVESDYDLYLKCKENWKDNPRVRCQCSRVDEKNINAFVDDKCDLLSIDTDGSDYEIFRGLKARPKIVIVEIDSSIEPPSERVNADGGVGYWTMTTLALESGYFLLVHCGNLIMIANKFRSLFPEIIGDGLSNYGLYFNPAWLNSK